MGFRYQYVTWAIDTGPELALAVAPGLVLGLAFLHVANGVAYLAGRIAVALLDGSAAPGAGARGADAGGSDASAGPALEDRGTADAEADDSSTDGAATDESNGGDSRPDG